MLLALVVDVALAIDVCVPADFQHWACDQTAADPGAAYALVDNETGPHTIHLKWDVVWDTQLTLDTNDLITFYGHVGPNPRTDPVRPQLPRLRRMRMDGAEVVFKNIELNPQRNWWGIEVRQNDGHLHLEDTWIVPLEPDDNTDDPIVNTYNGSLLTGVRTYFAKVTSNQDGAQLRLHNTSRAEFTDSTFEDAQGRRGGSVFVDNSATATFERCSFTGNTATLDGGGAIFVNGGELEVRESTFEGNHSTQTTDQEGGGAISVWTNSHDVSIADSLFCSNNSEEDGGALLKRDDGPFDVTRSVFWNNDAHSRGPGLYLHNSAGGSSAPGVTMNRVVMAANEAGQGADDGIYVRQYTDNNANNFNHLDVTHSFFQEIDGNSHGIEGGWRFEENAFTHASNRPLTANGGAESDNLFDRAVPYTGGSCSFEAFTYACDQLPQVDHPVGARLDCISGDQDLDKLMDHLEVALGTTLDDEDSDGDGLSDYEECPNRVLGSLVNPSFEDGAWAGLGTGVFTALSPQIPGWVGPYTMTASDGFGWSVDPEGTYALQVPVAGVTQAADVRPGEPLKLRLNALVPAGVPQDLEVEVAPQGGAVFASTTDQVTGVGAWQQVELDFTVPADVYTLEVRISASAVGTIYVDQVYLGPDHDTDGDGVFDCLDEDSDDDGVSDALEAGVTDPYAADTDGDGRDDSVDDDAQVADLDQDGLPDWLEVILGTDPGHADTDGDGVEDGVECPDVGVVNGSFEYADGAALGSYASPTPPADLPGWRDSDPPLVYLAEGGTGEWAPAAFGTHLSALQGGSNNLIQEIDDPPAEPLEWRLEHRGRWDDLSIQVRIEGGGNSFSMIYPNTTTEWSSISGTISSDGTPITFYFESLGGQSLIDGFAVVTASSYFAPDDLFCTNHAEQPSIDADGDGVDSLHDCDDADPHNYPGNVEVCDAQDNDCDDAIDEGVLIDFFLDFDGDGFGDVHHALPDCIAPHGYVTDSTDCDDLRSDIHPHAPELCDGDDNNCNNTIDEGLPTHSYYADHDHDGFGDPHQEVVDCNGTPPSGTVTNRDDCDDTDPQVYLGAAEACNGKDDDCDGDADEGLPLVTYYLDEDDDGVGGSTTLEVCDLTPPSGYASASGDCDDDEPTVFPGADETCNDRDDDCDTDVDEGLPLYDYYEDTDEDGFGDPSAAMQDCDSTAPAGFVGNDQDCDDDEATVNPTAHEACDTLDNDCDGDIDEDLTTTTYYLDADDDGFGELNAPPVARCEADPPSGFALTNDDCNDADPATNPGAQETCEPIDRDCDGNLELGAIDALPYYLDLDEDGFGLAITEIFRCSAPIDYVTESGDCNDDDDQIHPDAEELCNDIDDDCDTVVDNDATDATVFYEDLDGDQVGTENDTVEACDRPQGYAALTPAFDCVDSDNTVYPGAPELCDTKDNDCNGLEDDNISYLDFYPDGDGDGFGDVDGTPVNDCAPQPGTVANNGDCDDHDSERNPNQVETCDGVDDNCSGDESDAIDPNLYFADDDGDGWGDSSVVTFACEAPDHTSELSGDCNDSDALNYPGNIEVCDQRDNNCNGVVDTDSDIVPVWREDADADGFGSAFTIASCDQPTGFQPDTLLPSRDCDDDDATVYPGAPEVCDGVDNDCDGLGDLQDPDGPPTETYYPDVDGDTYGAGDGIEACEQVAGLATTDTDCNDADDTIYPGAPEACTGIDNNCNGTIEGEAGWTDEDLDGFGDANQPTCDDPTAVDNAADCDDADEAVNPDALEVCGNDVDEDCDGVVDECAVFVGVDKGCQCDAGAGAPLWLGPMLLWVLGVHRRRT